MKKIFKNDIDVKLHTILENVDSANNYRLREKQFGKEIDFKDTFSPVRDEECAKTVVKDQCHLTSKMRGLAHNECKTRRPASTGIFFAGIRIF